MKHDTPEGGEGQPQWDLGLPPVNALTDLYLSGAISPHYATFGFLPLMRAWLKELTRVLPHTYGRKVSGSLSYPPDYVRTEKLRTVRLEHGQTLTLRLDAYGEDPRDDGRRFGRVEVREAHSRTDKAALAALSVLEGSGVHPAETSRKDGKPGKDGINSIRKHLEFGADGENLDPEGEHAHLFERWLEGEVEGEEARRIERWSEAQLEGEEERLLAFARMLVRHHRPDLDQNSAEGVEILIDACSRVVAVADAARKLADFLEFGAAERDLRKAVEDTEMYIYAAELRHFAGMTNREIAERIGLDVSPEKERSSKQSAARAAQWGTDLLKRALGEDGWLEHKTRQRKVYHRQP